MDPETGLIGPYRLERRLGAGGMGEVYLAWDRRLDRRVAVKRIRADAPADSAARERFRREARLAAGLVHPAIVRIYDIVESDEGDALVMEYVEGSRLSQRIQDGTLDLPFALRLGREVAAGLAAAHARGIVHRDLKAENVMVTAEGNAKILDFGLAKQVSERSEDASLTRSGALLGTARAMSPEQAQGEPVDERSDLFSLGTLLYEMLTGRSPFLGSSRLDTLTRICSAHQQPLNQLDPRLSAELSSLVDDLLAKDPAHRPGAAAAAEALERCRSSSAGALPAASSLANQETVVEETVLEALPGDLPSSWQASAPRWARVRWPAAFALLAALSAFGVVYRLGGFGRPPLTVAVSLPAVEAAPAAASEDAALLAAGLRLAALRTLAALDRMVPLAPEVVDPVPGSPLQVARATAADEIVTLRLRCGAANCRVELSRLRGSDGRLLWAGAFSTPLYEPLLAAEAVGGHLRRGYPDHRERAGATELAVQPADYRRYLELEQAHRKGNYTAIDEPALLGQLAEIRRSSPRFLEAWSLAAMIHHLRFLAGRDRADSEAAVALLDEARRLAPGDPRPLYSLFEVSLATGQLDRAEAALGELAAAEPGYPLLTIGRARLAERRGRTDEARRLARRAVAGSASWQTLFWAATLEYRTGGITAARQDLARLLAQRPDHYVGRSLLAQLELLYGDPRRAVALYGQLVAASPEFDELTNLGVAHLLLRQYRPAEQRLRQAATLAPGNPAAALNLGDALLLRGREAEATAAYRRTLDLVKRDPAAAESWQHQTMRGQALAHLGRAREAVEAAQSALQLAPKVPQAALEIALIYTLVGDHASGLVHALRALDEGVEPGWFAYPWFDPLRGDPELAARLARHASLTPPR